jgi:hypothetical protein
LVVVSSFCKFGGFCEIDSPQVLSPNAVKVQEVDCKAA